MTNKYVEAFRKALKEDISNPNTTFAKDLNMDDNELQNWTQFREFLDQIKEIHEAAYNDTQNIYFILFAKNKEKMNTLVHNKKFGEFIEGLGEKMYGVIKYIDKAINRYGDVNGIHKDEDDYDDYE